MVNLALKNSVDGGDEDTGNFQNKKRSNDSHASTTDADARLQPNISTACYGASFDLTRAKKA
jgi:hypothetical protein